jgi:rRNA small subunit pseudouridine methyltransferase Nep1
MLTLILADAELELIPQRIWGHPAVVAYTKRRKKKAGMCLLDATYHHSAMKNLEEGDRRGRPDMVHFFLLLALDSILNQEGKLRVAVHTRNDEIIEVNPKTRLPKHYERFVGLIESLYDMGAVPSRKEPLLELTYGMPLKDYIEEIRKDERIMVMAPSGEYRKPGGIFRSKGDYIVIIGGFPEGDYRSPVYDVADEVVSIYDGMLKIWTVVSEVIADYERLNL